MLSRALFGLVFLVLTACGGKSANSDKSTTAGATAASIQADLSTQKGSEAKTSEAREMQALEAVVASGEQVALKGTPVLTSQDPEQQIFIDTLKRLADMIEQRRAKYPTLTTLLSKAAGAIRSQGVRVNFRKFSIGMIDAFRSTLAWDQASGHVFGRMRLLFASPSLGPVVLDDYLRFPPEARAALFVVIVLRVLSNLYVDCFENDKPGSCQLATTNPLGSELLDPNVLLENIGIGRPGNAMWCGGPKYTATDKYPPFYLTYRKGNACSLP